MKKLILTLLSVLLIMTFVGCSSITEGKVINKKFIPAHTDQTIITVPQRIGKITTIRTYPVTRSYPDQWQITFEGPNNKEELETRIVYVDKTTYDSYEIGDDFVYDKEKCNNEETYTEERN